MVNIGSAAQLKANAARGAVKHKAKARCPYCRKRVALTVAGKLHAHMDPATKTRCARVSPS